MGNENTSGGVTGKQIGGYGLCFLGIALWFLMALGILVQVGVLDEIAWLTPGSWSLQFAGGLLCVIEGRRRLCRESVEATPSKSDDDSGSTE